MADRHSKSNTMYLREISYQCARTMKIDQTLCDCLLLKRNFYGLKIRFLVKRQKRNLRRYRSFHQAVPEGTKAINLPSSRQTRRPLVSSDLLRCGNDWVFLFDLETGLIFPPEIASTTQRPGIVIYSKSKKIVVLIELTCPLEDRISTAHELKKDRYLELLSNCRCNGWTAFHFPVEVGSRGFVAFSLTSCLQKLGFPSYLAKKARNECSKIALRASYSIYLQRNIREWSGR